MLKKLFLHFILLFCLVQNLYAQLVAGPMLGYSEMREVSIWAQTDKPATLQYIYWEKGNTGQKFNSEEITTSKHNFYNTKVILTDVLPGKTYEYELLVNGKKVKFAYPLEFQTQTLWQFRTDPPAFSFAFGSCVYTNEPEFDRPGKPYGNSFKIFDEIYNTQPDFMVWGGDNIYLREVDWNTRSGIYKRYMDFKRQPELQKLFANTHHYATWDDHDYGPNDADRGYWGKRWALEAFKDNWVNPNYIFENEGVTGTFFWQDVQFFLLDDRWFRAPNNLPGDEKDYFGDKQIDWLIDALAMSAAPFKFIVAGGQIVNPSADFENMATYTLERQKLLDKITAANINGVIFLTGDRHHSALRKLERPGTYPLYDVTVSALTSGVAKPREEERASPDLIPGTIVDDLNNFGIFEVSGPRTDRSLKIKIIDNEGKERWSYILNARDLRVNRN